MGVIPGPGAAREYSGSYNHCPGSTPRDLGLAALGWPGNGGTFAAVACRKWGADRVCFVVEWDLKKTANKKNISPGNKTIFTLSLDRV